MTAGREGNERVHCRSGSFNRAVLILSEPARLPNIEGFGAKLNLINSRSD